MEMELVKKAYKTFEVLSDLRLLLLWDEKLCENNYATLKFIINECKNKIGDIINLIEINEMFNLTKKDSKISLDGNDEKE